MSKDKLANFISDDKDLRDKVTNQIKTLEELVKLNKKSETLY